MQDLILNYILETKGEKTPPKVTESEFATQEMVPWFNDDKPE